MIRFENVTKEFPNGTVALEKVSFHIERGEFTFLVGPSGAGKTTVLRLLLHELEPSAGDIILEGRRLSELKSKELPLLRRDIGAVFQDYKLIPDRTVKENISLVSDIIKSSEQEIEEHVNQILEKVGLQTKAELFPSQLSGGELQRTTIARALATHPKIIFADEPTGNLDQATGWEIVDLLLELNKDGTTVIVATHDEEIVNKINKRMIELKRGRIVSDTKEKVLEKEDQKKKESKKEKEEEEKGEKKKDDKTKENGDKKAKEEGSKQGKEKQQKDK